MSGATPRGQPWTPALALPHRRDGLSARRMAVLYTFREPSLGRQMHRELMRNALLDLTTIMPATTCHRRSYVETYSRYIVGWRDSSIWVAGCQIRFSGFASAEPWPYGPFHNGGEARLPSFSVRYSLRLFA